MKNWDTLDADVVKLIPVHYSTGREGHAITGIVLHHNAANLSGDDCYNTWLTRQASAHYQVQSDGIIYQLVNDFDTAWHSGDWNTNLTTIGIEHADIDFVNWTISDKTLDNGAHLVAALCKYYGLGRPEWMKNVFPHNHFSPTACPGAIAGSQNAAYMRRAGEWYDAMVSGNETINEEDDMPSANEVAQEVWSFTPADGNKQPFGNPYETLKRLIFNNPKLLKAKDSDDVMILFPVTGRVKALSEDQLNEVVMDYKNMGYPKFSDVVFATSEQRKKFVEALGD